jgi:hypothetical protein
MILHQGKVKTKIVFQVHMDQGYAKKDANPSKTTSLSISVTGFLTWMV